MRVVRVVGSRQKTAPKSLYTNGSPSRKLAPPPGEVLGELEEMKIFDMSQPFDHLPDEIMRRVHQKHRPLAARDRRDMYGSMLEEGGALAYLGGWKAQYVQGMTDFIDPFDHKLDRTLKFALHMGDEKVRYFEWAPWNIEGCHDLDIFRQSGFEFTVHSVLPPGSAYFKTVEEFDASATANYETSPAQFISGACKLRSFNLSVHNHFEELPVWRMPEERGLRSPNKHKMSLRHKAVDTVPGIYDWWMWYQGSDSTDEMELVVRVLGGNGAICWIPLIILLTIYGFCAAHPHPDGGWVYSLTPHDGFKAHSNAYANIVVTCAALKMVKCPLKDARKALKTQNDLAAAAQKAAQKSLDDDARKALKTQTDLAAAAQKAAQKSIDDDARKAWKTQKDLAAAQKSLDFVQLLKAAAKDSFRCFTEKQNLLSARRAQAKYTKYFSQCNYLGITPETMSQEEHKFYTSTFG